MLTAILLAAVLALQSPTPAAQALEDVRILAADDMEGRAPGTAGSARARAYILERYRQIGLAPAVDGGFEQPFEFSSRRGAGRGINLVGRIEGREPGGPVMLVIAHYDHDGVRNGEIFNGADDNASGVAGLLAVAQAFKQEAPRHTVIFAAVDAEEVGLQGSTWLADHFPGGIERLAFVLNLDMISKNDKGELWAAGPGRFAFLRPRIEAIAASAPVTLKIGHDQPTQNRRDDWTMLSDQGPFHRKGKPWIFLSVEDHAEYHTPQDDFETIPRPFFAGAVETTVGIARAMDADLAAIAAASPAAGSDTVR